jgi:hypothetical protein
VPAGARVIVDEKEAGRTPAAIRDLSQGPHTVRVVRDGYVAQERRIVLTRERPVQNVIMPLQKEKTAEVARPTPTATRGQAASAPTGLSGMSVESRPPGAKVFFDNKMIGITPLSVPEAPIGQHSIRLELDGYQNWTAAVRIVSGDQNRVRASLEPR